MGTPITTIVGEVLTIGAAGAAWFNAHRTQKVVKPNGESLFQVLAEVREILVRTADLEAYQHARNHDLMNTLQRIDLRLAHAFPIEGD